MLTERELYRPNDDLAQFLAAVDERAKYHEQKAEAGRRVAELV